MMLTVVVSKRVEALHFHNRLFPLGVQHSSRPLLHLHLSLGSPHHRHSHFGRKSDMLPGCCMDQILVHCQSRAVGSVANRSKGHGKTWWLEGKMRSGGSLGNGQHWFTLRITKSLRAAGVVTADCIATLERLKIEKAHASAIEDRTVSLIFQLQS